MCGGDRGEESMVQERDRQREIPEFLADLRVTAESLFGRTRPSVPTLSVSPLPPYTPKYSSAFTIGL